MTAPRFSLRGSIAARLALGYGVLVALSIAAVAAVFYFGTVGVFQHSIDARINAVAEHLLARYQAGGRAALESEIRLQLSDRIDTDTEILVLLSPDGHALAGNLGEWTGPVPPPDQLDYLTLARDRERFSARLVVRALDGGYRLVVGRDLRELDAIRGVIARALLVGCLVSLLLAFGGALMFRRQIERRIGRIRRTAAQIAAGDLSRRIAVHGDDEFARLNADINEMLDRIEDLMEGVRHVSNAIAHDMRTPLGRLRARLEAALDAPADREQLAASARAAIDDLDGVIDVFDKLLQIAAAESGVRAASFEMLDLREIATDIVELYEPAAEAQDMQLTLAAGQPAFVVGDRQLVANALANLIDNALKYGHPGGKVLVSMRDEGGAVALVVRDDGPGIPPSELNRVCERFYRVDRSRHQPGNGLGLSIVTATAHLHGGSLTLANANPGLEASLVLPALRNEPAPLTRR